MMKSGNESSSLTERLRLLNELRRRQCENSFYEFMLDSFKVLNPAEELITNWHMKYLCDKLQGVTERVAKREKKPLRNGNLLINVPPRSLKSIIVTVAWNAWSWIVYPQMKFISSSYSGDLAIDHNIMTKQIINSTWYQSKWGHIFEFSKDQNTKGHYANNKTGSRKCTSTGGTITGKGGDVIIVDDPTNPKEAASDAERKIANDFFDLTLSSRLNNAEIGMFVVIMQRLHEDDLTGHLLERLPGQWEHICIPAELESNIFPKEIAQHYVDGLFFPARFNRNFLDIQLTMLGSQGYAGQYSQSPSSAEGNIFNPAWFGRFNLNDIRSGIVWNFAADTAYTVKTVNDPSVIFAFAIYRKNLYIRAVSEVWLDFPRLLKHIKQFAMANGYSARSKLYIEPKASGKSIVQALKYDSGINVVEDDPPSKDKVTRAQSVAPIVEAERVYLLNGAPWIDKFLHQVATFPNSKHDDIVDTLVIALNKTKLQSFGGAKYAFYKNR